MDKNLDHGRSKISLIRNMRRYVSLSLAAILLTFMLAAVGVWQPSVAQEMPALAESSAPPENPDHQAANPEPGSSNGVVVATPVNPDPRSQPQTPNDRIVVVQQNPDPKIERQTEGTSRARPKTSIELFLSGLTIALGIFMAVLLCVMGWKSGMSDMFVRAFIVVMVIFAALFLIVAGYDEQQTAPVFGILGTVLGYIFGRTEKTEVVPTNQSSTPTLEQPNPPEDEPIAPGSDKTPSPTPPM